MLFFLFGYFTCSYCHYWATYLTTVVCGKCVGFASCSPYFSFKDNMHALQKFTTKKKQQQQIIGKKTKHICWLANYKCVMKHQNNTMNSAEHCVVCTTLKNVHAQCKTRKTSFFFLEHLRRNAFTIFTFEVIKSHN